MTTNEFGSFLNKLRRTQGLSIRQLEKLSGVSNAYLSQLETGKREIPSVEIIKKLHLPLGVEYNTLMEKAGYIGESSDKTRIKSLEEELKVANNRIEELESTLKGVVNKLNITLTGGNSEYVGEVGYSKMVKKSEIYVVQDRSGNLSIVTDNYNVAKERKDSLNQTNGDKGVITIWVDGKFVSRES